MLHWIRATKNEAERGTMNGYLSYLGFVAEVAMAVQDQLTVDKED